MKEYNIAVAGVGGVGKTSLIMRLICDHFANDVDPTLEESYRKSATIDDERCLLCLFDTAGYDHELPLREEYINLGQGFLVVYSVTCRSSFEVIPFIIQRILRVKDREKVPIVVVGSLYDLDIHRQVKKNEGEALAESFGCPFFETSAKDRINIEESFYSLVREIREDDQKNSNPFEKPKKNKKKEKDCLIV